MNPEDLRGKARRRWRAAERGKRAHWTREVVERGALATFEASQAIWEHLRGLLRPDWPTPLNAKITPTGRTELLSRLDEAMREAFEKARQELPGVRAQLRKDTRRARGHKATLVRPYEVSGRSMALMVLADLGLF